MKIDVSNYYVRRLFEADGVIAKEEPVRVSTASTFTAGFDYMQTLNKYYTNIVVNHIYNNEEGKYVRVEFDADVATPFVDIPSSLVEKFLVENLDIVLQAYRGHLKFEEKGE